MIIKTFKCNNCEHIHERKFYENQSEGVADIFTEGYFFSIWDRMKEKMKEKNIEDFCKELVFTAVYNYHKNRRRIKVAQNTIEPTNGTESQAD